MPDRFSNNFQTKTKRNHCLERIIIIVHSFGTLRNRVIHTLHAYYNSVMNKVIRKSYSKNRNLKITWRSKKKQIYIYIHIYIYSLGQPWGLQLTEHFFTQLVFFNILKTFTRKNLHTIMRWVLRVKYNKTKSIYNC